MARSSPDPTLRTVGGARFTVTRCIGHVQPLERSAARTRPLASRQAASGDPTTVKDGSPLLDVHLDRDGVAVDAEQGG